jgi:predicted MFS family arabinose efflux permease
MNVRAATPTNQDRTLLWLLVSSWMWHLTRWDGLFLCAYLVTHLGGPPIDNQLVGVAMFAPMLLGANISKLIRTRLDSRILVVATETALLPVSALMAVLVGGGAVQTWMAYPYMLSYGFGGMINMTAQREVIFRLAGPLRAERTLNIETAGIASAMMIGPLLGGFSINVSGLGAAFAMPAVLLVGSLLALWRASPGMALSALSASSGTTHDESVGGRGGLGQLLKLPTFVAVLAVTVIANLCYFAFMPLVPVIAKNLGAGAALAGVIGSAAGTVQLVGAAAFVARPARRGGLTYVGGVALCLCCLALLSFAPTVLLALLALGVAGIGQAMFSATQAILPVTAVPPHERSVALGVLSTTIGVALPTGMLILGLSSSVLGARLAMLVSALVGVGALATLVVRHPGLLHDEQSHKERSDPELSGRAVRAGREGDAVAAQPELG